MTDQKVYPRYLQFVKNRGLTSQKLLFDESTPISPSPLWDVEQEFYDKGYAVINDVSTAESAGTVIEKFIASIDTTKYPLFERFASRVQLAKLDQIPVCDDIVHTTFQAMHFDMGHPIVSDSIQVMYFFIGLYCPYETTNATAKTRVVNIKKLLSQREWDNVSVLEKKLIDYVNEYGDGWTEPEKVNTYRLSSFARLIDAVTGRNELKDWINKTTGQWFQIDGENDGVKRMQREYQYFKESGLDLESEEEQIALQPGQLLIIDNVRTAHGRVGKRKAKELWQFLYAVKDATPEDISEYRKGLVGMFG